MLVHVILFGLCWLGLCTASNSTDKQPGIVVRILGTALASFGEMGSDYIMADYASGTMPNVTDTEKCLHDSCSLQNIAINKYVSPKSTVNIKPGIGVEWCLKDASCDMEFDFEIETEDECVKGRAQVSLSGISLEAMITLKRGMDGRLVVYLTNCSIDIEMVYSHVIDATGEDFSDQSRSDFYKAISTYFGDSVYESVYMTMCNKTQYITEIIPNYLHWMDLQFQLLGLAMDTCLVRNPSIEVDMVEVALSGEIRLLNDTEEAPMQPPLLELPSSESSMVALYVSPLVFNTGLDALFRSKWFSVNVTKDSFPLKYEHRNLLDTTCDGVCLGTVLPYLAMNYPNSSATLAIEVSKRPSTNISKSIARFNVDFVISIVISGENISEVVAKTSVSVCMSVIVFLSGNRLEGRVYKPKLLITDNGSPKEFASDLSRWLYVLQLIAEFCIIPQLNYHGAVGIPLEKLFGSCIRFLDRDDLRPSADAFVLNADIVHDRISC